MTFPAGEGGWRCWSPAPSWTCTCSPTSVSALTTLLRWNLQALELPHAQWPAEHSSVSLATRGAPAAPGAPLFLCGSPPLPAPPAPAAFCPCRAAFSGSFRQMHSCSIHLLCLAPFTEQGRLRLWSRFLFVVGLKFTAADRIFSTRQFVDIWAGSSLAVLGILQL